MKKRQLAGLLVATFGVIASFATAAALYVGPAEDVEFPIGKAQWVGKEGAITYKINNATTGTATPHYLDKDGKNGGAALGGDYVQVEYDFNLTGEYGSGLIAQNYVTGNFSVSLTNINENLFNKAEISCVVDGYLDNVDTKGASYGYANFREIAIDSELTKSTFGVNKNITVASNGTQTVKVYIKLKSNILDTNGKLTGDAALSLAESKLCDISVTWAGPSNEYSFAHVVGDATEFNEDNPYAMNCNINKANSEGFEWTFNGLTGFKKGKCRKGDTWSKGDDAVLDSSKTYDVYWNGSNESNASFSEHK